MPQIVVGDWHVTVHDGRLPASYEWYAEHALLNEAFDIRAREGRPFFVAVSTFGPAAREHGKPLLAVAQNVWPDYESGFDPGVLIVPETSLLFVGAGERLLAYDLQKPARLWEDHADCGFQAWGRYSDFVWMSAEIEFAVWRLDGTQLWTTFVDPPCDLSFADGLVTLDAFDKKRTLRMADGSAVS
jgi:hypothetical protein